MDAGAAPVVYADAAPCTFVLPDGEHRVVVHCPADHSTLAVNVHNLHSGDIFEESHIGAEQLSALLPPGFPPAASTPDGFRHFLLNALGKSAGTTMAPEDDRASTSCTCTEADDGHSVLLDIVVNLGSGLMAVSLPVQIVLPLKSKGATICLDVGGTRYTSLLSTMLAAQNSRLFDMFSMVADSQAKAAPLPEGNPAAHAPPQGPDGTYIVARDGPMFQHILNYLHDWREIRGAPGELPVPGQTLSLPDALHELQRLKREAEYFRLPELIHACRAQIQTKGSRFPPLGDDDALAIADHVAPFLSTGSNPKIRKKFLPGEHLVAISLRHSGNSNCQGSVCYLSNLGRQGECQREFVPASNPHYQSWNVMQLSGTPIPLTTEYVDLAQRLAATSQRSGCSHSADPVPLLFPRDIYTSHHPNIVAEFREHLEIIDEEQIELAEQGIRNAKPSQLQSAQAKHAEVMSTIKQHEELIAMMKGT